MLQYLKSFFLLQTNSTNSSCPSPAKWCVDGDDGYEFCLQNPTLLPACILALLIGLFCSKRISKLPGKFPSRWFYHSAFFLYGIMMTSAGILHCFIGDQQTTESAFGLIVAVIDVGLTTSIAITFLFCGLCDIKFLNPQSIITNCLLFILYLTVFVLWTLGIQYNWNWVYHVLYEGVIVVCCFIYLITQLCIKSKRSSLPALIVGGIYGAIGLLAKTYGAEHICKSEGPFWSQYIGPEFIWFLFSDISMAFVFVYVIRANRGKQADVKKYEIDIEKNPEKF
jgi:hypothetical protein